MPSTRALARYGLLLALAAAVPARAQDADPGAPAADEPAGEAPKPKRKPAPKPRPKVEHRPAAQAPAPAQASTQAPAPAPAAQAAPGPLWPPGATSVTEGYGDWTVNCTRANEQPACTVAQSQGDAKTGRRKFGIELQTPRDGRAQGVVLMPFGLAIEPGVTFKLDEQALGQGASYASCNADGCLVPISLPKPATDGMRASKNLYVTGHKGSVGGAEGEAVTLTVPLADFPQALDRAIALGG